MAPGSWVDLDPCGPPDRHKTEAFHLHFLHFHVPCANSATHAPKIITWHTTRRHLQAHLSILRPFSHPSSMDPNLKNLTKPISRHATSKNPDHTIPSKHFHMSNPLSKFNPNRKLSTFTQKPAKNPLPPCVDTHLQAKSMSLSADFDGSRLSIFKPKHQYQKRIESIGEKDSRVAATKEDSKDKVKKVSSKGLVDKKKGQEMLVIEKKKEIHATVKDNKEVKDPVEGLDIKRMTFSLRGGRRRSFGGSQMELADFLAHNGAKLVSVDMPPFMQIHAVDCARKTCDSLEKFTSKTLALTLKKEFDGVYGPAWHCIVGTSFGSFVTHSVGGFLYFSMDQKLKHHQTLFASSRVLPSRLTFFPGGTGPSVFHPFKSSGIWLYITSKFNRRAAPNQRSELPVSVQSSLVQSMGRGTEPDPQRSGFRANSEL